MSVAIVTKYHGPTNYRGSRITASVPSRVAESRRHVHGADCASADDAEHVELYRVGHWTLTLPYDYALSGEELHRVAAQALADRLGWSGRLVGGALDDGYAFTFDDGRPTSGAWSAEPGRNLYHAGAYVLAIATNSGRGGTYTGASPAGLDAMAHAIADALNAAGVDPADALREHMAR